MTDEERKTRKRKQAKTWREANRERRRELNRNSHHKLMAEKPETYRKQKRDAANKTRATIPGYDKRKRQRYEAKHPGKRAKIKRKSDLKWMYGLTLEAYDLMVIAQNNRCALCKTDTFNGKDKRWHVDHCRETNMVRGLLCTRCNMGLGYFKHDISLLQIAIDYLDRPPAWADVHREKVDPVDSAQPAL